MITQTMHCDRCGTEIPMDEWINCKGQRLFRKKYFLQFSDKWKEVDLCQKCYDSLAKWMKEGKE